MHLNLKVSSGRKQYVFSIIPPFFVLIIRHANQIYLVLYGGQQSMASLELQ